MMRLRVLACMLHVLISSCGDEALTEIVAVVSTDLVPGVDFVRIEVQVQGGAIVEGERLGTITDGAFSREVVRADGGADRQLPFSFGLLPVDSSTTVRVRAVDTFGRVVVEQTRVATFRRGSITKLGITLALTCVGVGIECTDFRGETCVDGLCVPLAATDLPIVLPLHELDGLPQPPTIDTRLVQRSRSLTGLETQLGDAPGGTFTLGADDLPTVSPANAAVVVSAFRVDTREVTLERFRTFRDAIVRNMRGRIGYPDGTSREFGAPTLPSSSVVGCGRILDMVQAKSLAQGQPDLPITCVDWHTAQAFCAFEGGRLPTSAEWEYVAHGRTGMASALAYPWGNTLPSHGGLDSCTHAWFFECGDDTSPWPRAVALLDEGVQTSSPGAAVFDLAGNVAEWTADRYESFAERSCWPPTPLTNPSCPFDGLLASGEPNDEVVIVRGGAIAPIGGADDGIIGLRAAATTPRLASASSPYVGFRCVYDQLP